MNGPEQHSPDPLDQTLDQYRVNAADEKTRAQILAAAHAHPQQPAHAFAAVGDLLRAIGGWPVAGPALAFSMLLGVGAERMTRDLTPTASTGNTETTTIWELALLSTDSLISDELQP